MTKASRQHLRSRLRNYQTTTWNIPASSSSVSTSTVSVVEMLSKLRLEQGRAERNRLNTQVSKIGTSESFRPYEYIREHVVNPIPPISQDEAQREAERMRALELIPGPPPPESWRTLHGKEKSKLETAHKEKWLLHHSREQGVESLANTCARVVSRHLESFYSLRQDDELYDFTTIPFQAKERILYCAALELPISDKILPMFIDNNYEDLCFENATISFAKFVRAFWKIVRRRPRQIVETWEELAPEDGSDDGSDYDGDSNNDKVEISPALNDTGLSMQQYGTDEDEQDLIFPPYLVSIFSLAPTVTLFTHAIQTQLATTVRHLNLSFTSFPAVPLAHLIVTTLSQLTRLSLAGCFERRDGPHGLSILSRGLPYLEHLDLSYCDWLSPDILAGQSAFVNWARDWRTLRILIVRASVKHLDLLPPNDLPSQLTRWLDSVRLAACKISVVAN